MLIILNMVVAYKVYGQGYRKPVFLIDARESDPGKQHLEEIQSCHSESYTLLFGANLLNRPKLDASKLADLPMKNFVMLPCGGIGVDSDTTWNDLHTASAARMAAGCAVELAMKLATNEIEVLLISIF
ncbi:histone deacetylase 4-like [Parasteatoda tepidariorum]|uniref:histone deacetylase 4-like n=1 Tax=Parasteatoda tepidariorum TaxID=114398 RepID=UPI001C71A482|nr:histone deacetylase 4-like [Parasteatoda tepidariorum]